MEYRWTGKKISHEGGSVQLDKVLDRHMVYNLGESVIIARGRGNEGDRPIVAKLRVELGLDNNVDREAAERYFNDELAALKELGDSGGTPHLLASGVTAKSQSMPYPNGYIRVLIILEIPGQNVDNILLDLEEDERASMENQLANVLDKLVWDRKGKRV
ncbi:MAG: hypothetical protein M1840_003941 [Geoglossum simile]|nr:MAG: hypothetical protein M1840_003941 [Geoglossum simile]